jgi:hypothetical protein
MRENRIHEGPGVHYHDYDDYKDGSDCALSENHVSNRRFKKLSPCFSTTC